MKPKFTLFFLLFMLHHHVFCQNDEVKWGEIQKSNGRLIDILPVSGSNFYSLRWMGGLFGSYALSRHDHFLRAKSKRIELKVESGMAVYEGAHLIGDKLMVFLSDRTEGKNHFFLQEYDNEIAPKGPSIEIASYEMEKGRGKGSFDVITSRNKRYFAVVWSIPGKKDAKDRYGFKVMDLNLQELSSGEYDLPYDPKLCSIDNYYLSNTGDYFMSLTEFEKGEKKVFRNFLDYRSVHILHITGDEIEDMTLDLGGKRIEAMVMNSDNNKLFTIAGIVGEKGKAGTTGLIYLSANFSTKEILNERFEKFGKDFITQDWSDRQKNRAEKREANGKGEPQLYNYVMRQSEVLRDGSIVGSMEQYYVSVQTFTDPRTGATRTTYTYYYNDIIAFKVNPDGGFDWLTKIRKSQITNNDSGYLSSYLRFIDQQKLCFVFNDNVVNYDDKGEFVKTDRLYPAGFSKKRNVAAIVEIDLENGSSQRRMFFDRKKIGTILVPKQCKIDYAQKEILMYGISGRKERFGILPFHD